MITYHCDSQVCSGTSVRVSSPSSREVKSWVSAVEKGGGGEYAKGVILAKDAAELRLYYT